MQRYSQLQASQWRQLPYWALQAKGKINTTSADLFNIYRHGLLPLSSPFVAICDYNHYVDLETGSIIQGHNQQTDSKVDLVPLNPHLHPSILCLDKDELDANAWLARLQQAAQSDFPDSLHPQDRQQIIDHQQCWGQLLGLRPDTPYTRSLPIKLSSG